MRKISSYLGKIAVDAKNDVFSGKICSFYCDLRLRKIEYLLIEPIDGDNAQKLLLPPRSANKLTDENEVLSNFLCTKHTDEVDVSLMVENPLGLPVLTSSGATLGKIEDIYFGDTDKLIVGLSVNGGIVLPERIEKVTDDGVYLLPDGRKRATPKRREIKRPVQNFAVALPENESPESVSVIEPQSAPAPTIINDAPASYMPARVIGNFRFLVGRTATASVYDKKHSLIVKAGALITDDVVLRAHKNNLLVELTLKSRR